MAASQVTRGGGCEDARTAERRGRRWPSEGVVKNSVFVACTELKEEPEEAVDRKVKNSVFVTCTELKEEPEEAVDRKIVERLVPKCEMCIEESHKAGTFEEISIPGCNVQVKQEADEAGSFEEISIPGCNVQVKQEVDEAEAVAAAPALEPDQLKTEDEEVAASTRNTPDSERMMQNTSLECSTSPAIAARRTAAHNMTGVRPARSVRRGLQIERTGQQLAPVTRSSRSAVGEPEDFTCSSCQKTFPSKYKLLLHVFIHMVDVKPPQHICRLCGEVFASRRSLVVHSKMRDTQCTVARQGNGGLGSSNRRETYQKQQNIQCSRDTQTSCDGSFQQTEIYTSQPERTDSDRYQAHISNEITLPKYKQTDTQAVQGSNAGDKSNTSLMSTAHLKQRAVEHSVQLPFKCNSCDRYFRYQVHLQQHAASHQKKLLMCNHCNKTFKRPVDLRQHRLSHTGEKPHVCECGKSFAKSDSLKRHERVHRGERPYTCKVCFKSFTDASVLKNHTVVHTGERAYVCADCGKAFKELGHLRRHLLLHTGEKPYICSVCGVSFNQSSTLTTHTRMHTGEKPYKCHICFKTFSDRSNWRAHCFVHHADKIHKCPICEKHFLKRHDLVQHVRVHIL